MRTSCVSLHKPTWPRFASTQKALVMGFVRLYAHYMAAEAHYGVQQSTLELQFPPLNTFDTFVGNDTVPFQT